MNKDLKESKDVDGIGLSIMSGEKVDWVQLRPACSMGLAARDYSRPRIKTERWPNQRLVKREEVKNIPNDSSPSAERLGGNPQARLRIAQAPETKKKKKLADGRSETRHRGS